MDSKSRGVLTSPLFIVAVATLILNDFVFKKLAPGFITGKLSDFAGLFAFALFWCAFFPAQRLMIHIATAVLFIVWKSPLVQPLIDSAALPIGRTIDWSDLAALVVLPFAFAYSKREWPIASRRTLAASIAIASMAFAATSYRSRVEYPYEFFFDGSPEELVQKLKDEGVAVYETDALEYQLTIPADFCFDDVEAFVVLKQEGERTRLRLAEMVHRCPRRRDEYRDLFHIFGKAVIDPLLLRAVK